MTAPVLHIIRNNHFWLTAQRCMFWEEEKALILSDLHLGKTGHFRKNGIAVPQSVFKEDLQTLIELISYFNPDKIIAVGDLFHSEANREMDFFLKWRNNFKHISFILVRGNHDILHQPFYDTANIDVNEGIYSLGGFDFVHDPEEANERLHQQAYIFSGHLHPGINISGQGKQSLQFPCYYFSPTMAVLPAFSKFSGISIMKKKKQDMIYAIVNQSLVNIK